MQMLHTKLNLVCSLALLPHICHATRHGLTRSLPKLHTVHTVIHCTDTVSRLHIHKIYTDCTDCTHRLCRETVNTRQILFRDTVQTLTQLSKLYNLEKQTFQTDCRDIHQTLQTLYTVDTLNTHTHCVSCINTIHTLPATLYKLYSLATHTHTLYIDCTQYSNTDCTHHTHKVPYTHRLCTHTF